MFCDQIKSGKAVSPVCKNLFQLLHLTGVMEFLLGVKHLPKSLISGIKKGT
eukprot:UN01774